MDENETPPARKGPPPSISVVVLCYRMRREVPRTITSLSPDYQRIGAHLYDIELAEMPSDDMLTDADKAGFPANLRHTVETRNYPLSQAVNRAVRRTRGEHVLICVDGARILTPGILHRCRQLIKINPRGVVAVHGMHLGRRPQQVAVPDGTHDRQIEDRLLESVDFPKRPYQLFSIASWAGSSRHGWFGPMAESCAILVAREHFEELGGYDEKVTTPGGGLANSDFYTRALADRRRPLFVPLGEATFHQYHGGSTTSAQGGYGALKSAFEEQTGRPFVLAPERPTHHFGILFPQAYPPALKSFLSVLRSGDGERPAEGMEAVEAALARAMDKVDGQAPRAPMTLVIGMHRSGTSFLTRQLVQAGLVVPGTAMGGSQRSNPEGHHEPFELVAWHNRLLSSLGLSWAALGRVDAAKRGKGFPERLARGLRRLLLDFDARDEPTTHEGWVLKDPRICITRPIWSRACALMQVEPATLLVLRDPTLVAQSLARRDGFDLDYGRLLWARYVQGLLSWADDADDILTLDTADAGDVSAYIRRRTGREIASDPVERAHLPDADDPITSLYRTFLAERDLAAFRSGLDAELAFADRYPGVIARLDRLAGTAD